VFLHCWQPENEKVLEQLYKPKLSEIVPQRNWTSEAGDWLKEYNYPLDTMDDLVSDRRYSHLVECHGEKVWEDLRHHAERSRSRWYGNQRVVKLKKQYEDENNIKYDFVVVGRYDLWFEKVFPLDDLDAKYFYASQRTNGDILREDHEYSLQDLFFLGNSELIDKFYTLYDHVSDYAIESPKAAWEHMQKSIGQENFKFFPWKFHKEYNLIRWRFRQNTIPELRQ